MRSYPLPPFQDWPIAAFTGVLHLLSLAVSYVIFYRLFGVAGWIVEALTFNSLTSFPLLILAGLARSPGLLNHIFRTDIEPADMVIRRATSYILLNAAISEALRWGALWKREAPNSVADP